MAKTEKEPPDRAAYSVDEFCKMIGVSPASAYKSMKAGTLRTVKICGRRLVTAEELKRILELGAE